MNLAAGFGQLGGAELDVLGLADGEVIFGFDFDLAVADDGQVFFGAELAVAVLLNGVVAFVADADLLVVLDVLVDKPRLRPMPLVSGSSSPCSCGALVR